MADVSPADHANEWQLGLVGLTGAEIAEGIDKARRECAWPPTIAEFRKLATGYANAEQRAFAARSVREDHGSLPQGTWEDRKQVAAKQLRSLLEELQGHEQAKQVSGQGL